MPTALVGISAPAKFSVPAFPTNPPGLCAPQKRRFPQKRHILIVSPDQDQSKRIRDFPRKHRILRVSPDQTNPKNQTIPPLLGTPPLPLLSSIRNPTPAATCSETERQKWGSARRTETVLLCAGEEDDQDPVLARGRGQHGALMGGFLCRPQSGQRPLGRWRSLASVCAWVWVLQEVAQKASQKMPRDVSPHVNRNSRNGNQTLS